jgi:dTDP-glucose pyrophosphorylase
VIRMDLIKKKKDWRKGLLSERATLQQAIQNLDDSGLQISMIVAANGELLGTLTDGDIRRGLMRGMEMNEEIDSVIHTNFLVVPLQVDRQTALQLMQANKIHQLPIVDDENRVVGLHLWDELLARPQRKNTMVIMAGGLGTRLRPHTDNCPKPMLLVGNKPILEHIIKRASNDGFYNFVLAIHYLGHMVEDYFGDGSKWNVKIDYLREESPLGTAGAISLMKPCPDTSFIVTNGDVLTDMSYGELLDFHTHHKASATMAVRVHEWQNPFGTVQTNGVDIIGFEEKPIIRNQVNAGIYVIEPEVLDSLNSGERFDMPELFNKLKNQSARTIVYPMHESWLDVGREDDYVFAQKKVMEP